mmetsp:Transcript_98739/g.318439  ORF Transcript_98739/g.318439 Transcript_98739/m.318439 type:complete len:258 (-) Transcript_98739:3-776(-)
MLSRNCRRLAQSCSRSTRTDAMSPPTEALPVVVVSAVMPSRKLWKPSVASSSFVPRGSCGNCQSNFFMTAQPVASCSLMFCGMAEASELAAALEVSGAAASGSSASGSSKRCNSSAWPARASRRGARRPSSAARASCSQGRRARRILKHSFTWPFDAFLLMPRCTRNSRTQRISSSETASNASSSFRATTMPVFTAAQASSARVSLTTVVVRRSQTLRMPSTNFCRGSAIREEVGGRWRLWRRRGPRGRWKTSLPEA